MCPGANMMGADTFFKELEGTVIGTAMEAHGLPISFLNQCESVAFLPVLRISWHDVSGLIKVFERPAENLYCWAS
jgi:hypothetical protein